MNWHIWLNQCIAWINIVLVGVALGFAIAWPRRKGKALIVTSLSLLLAMILIFMLAGLVMLTRIFEWSMMESGILRSVGVLAGVASHALLLAYVVAARRLPASEAAAGAEDTGWEASGRETEPMAIGRVLFSFQGRLRRRDYWLKGFLVLLPIGIVNNILAYGVDSDGARTAAIIIGIASMWPSFALIVKRLHDRNRSGWFAATILIPFANIVFAVWILIEVWFLRGTTGPNRFGLDPVWERA